MDMLNGVMRISNCLLQPTASVSILLPIMTHQRSMLAMVAITLMATMSSCVLAEEDRGEDLKCWYRGNILMVCTSKSCIRT